MPTVPALTESVFHSSEQVCLCKDHNIIISQNIINQAAVDQL